jgi:hypothetical protein
MMNTREMAERMVTRLGEYVGQEDLKLDQNGSSIFNLEGFLCRLDYDQSLGALLTSVYAGNLSKSLDPIAVLDTALKANLLWEGSAGGTFGLKDGELSLVSVLDLENSFPEADTDPPDDFLFYYLPRLFGAAATTLTMCGEEVY